MKIEKKKTDWHCAVTKDVPKKIKAEQSSWIKIICDCTGCNYFEQIIDVYSNDKERNSNMLIIKGSVVA